MPWLKPSANWHTLSPKSKWTQKGHFCCCIKLTHEKDLLQKYSNQIFLVICIWQSHRPLPGWQFLLTFSNWYKKWFFDPSISNNLVLNILKISTIQWKSWGLFWDSGSKQLDYVVSWFRFSLPKLCCSWVTNLNHGTKHKQGWNSKIKLSLILLKKYITDIAKENITDIFEENYHWYC